MKQRISSLDTEHHQASLYLYGFFGLLLFIGILINIFKGQFDLVLGFGGLFIFLIIGLIITRYYLNFLRIAFIDDSYLYISQNDLGEIKIPLDNIKSVSYFWYPASIKAERLILIKYLNREKSLKKVLIIPAHLDKDNKFKWNRNILGLIKNKIKNYCDTK